MRYSRGGGAGLVNGLPLCRFCTMAVVQRSAVVPVITEGTPVKSAIGGAEAWLRLVELAGGGIVCSKGIETLAEGAEG